jgi:formylglycine-generating enzyme required for sulfatase activity
MRIKWIFLLITICFLGQVSAQKKGAVSEEQKQKIQSALGEFVVIPGGKFIMGSPITEEGRGNDEKQHEVLLSPYAIQAIEVTQRLWTLVMPQNPSSDRTWLDYPVTHVSYLDAMEFIGRLNQITGEKYSLPTEAQWEFAARANNEKAIYGGGDGLTPNGWFALNAESRVHVAGESLPNAFGIFDMSGNVSEWCSDLYADYRLDTKSKVDPKGADRSDEVVLRGGNWKSTTQECRVADRMPVSKDWHKDYIGFRLVKLNP